MVNPTKLEQMLSNLREFTRNLKGLRDIPRDDFLADPHKIGNAKYQFVIAIECCVDIASHVISSEGYRLPETNADAFKVLVEEGILPDAMLTTWSSMAGFRNRLVHLYWDVDDAKVYEYLQNSLDDLDAFRERLADLG